MWEFYQNFEVVVAYECLDREFDKGHGFYFFFLFIIATSFINFCKSGSIKAEDEVVPGV